MIDIDDVQNQKFGECSFTIRSLIDAKVSPSYERDASSLSPGLTGAIPSGVPVIRRSPARS
jgi:hypothetical protein